MGLFNRGQAASALILDGKRAVRAYLGDQLVWDGTMDAFVPIPQILVSVVMADPVVSATGRTVAPLITAAAQVHEASVSGTATVRPETAILVTGTVYPPDVSADALIEVPAISVSAIVLAPTVSEAFDATVEAPSIQVTAGMYSPKITADYAATVPIIAAFAELLAPLVTATGTAVINAPMIAVTGSVNAPAVIGSSSVVAPLIAVSATVYAPELRRDAKVIAPLIAGSGTLYAPNVQGINFTPSGMTKSGTFATSSSSTPVQVTGWGSDPTYPGSTVTSNALVASGTKTATVEAAVVFTRQYFNQTYKVEVRRGATVVASQTVVAPANTGTYAVSITPTDIAVTSGDQLTVWASVTGFNNTVIEAGTFIRLT